MRSLTRALAACSLFSLVEYAYWTALLLYTFDKGGATLASLVLLAQLVPAAALATPLGALGDRLPRGAALSGTYAAEALALAMMAVLIRTEAPLLAIVGSATVATVLVSVARPIHNAALPQLAHSPRALVNANAFTSLVDGIGVFLGPVLAGLATQRVGFGFVPACCAAAMGAAALLTARLGLPAPEPGDQDSDDGWLGGVRVVRQDRSVFALLVLVGVAYVVMGSLEILGVAFASDVLGGDGSTAGFVVGAVGIGTFLGSLLSAGLTTRSRLSPAIVLALVFAGVPLVVMVAVSALPAAVLLLTVCGMGLVVSSVAGRTLLQRTTDARVLARVFGVQEAVMMLGLALGALVAPLAIGLFGAAMAYLPIGLGLVVIALAVAPLLRHLDLRLTFRPDIMASLRRVPFLAALKPPAKEQLAQAAVRIEIAPETTVIEQGALGDAFYVVEGGHLSVTKDGDVLPTVLHRGDGFGELALLRDAPRAATITSLDECRLLVVRREDFLSAVTGVADGRAVADEVAAAYEARARVTDSH